MEILRSINGIFTIESILYSNQSDKTTTTNDDKEGTYEWKNRDENLDYNYKTNTNSKNYMNHTSCILEYRFQEELGRICNTNGPHIICQSVGSKKNLKE